MGNIYDGVFRTILNDCRKLVIPIINEIFGETYTGEEEISFFPNEHFIDRQDGAGRERITDTNFRIVDKKYHLECESSLPDGRIAVRLFEYDAQIALDEGEITQETFENVRKGIGDIMGGALIETEARTILKQGIARGIEQGIEQGKSQGIDETRKKTALKLLKRGKLTVEEIAEDTELSVEEVEQFAAGL